MRRANEMAERGRNESWHDGLELEKMRSSFAETEKSIKKRFKGPHGAFSCIKT